MMLWTNKTGENKKPVPSEDFIEYVKTEDVLQLIMEVLKRL